MIGSAFSKAMTVVSKELCGLLLLATAWLFTLGGCHGHNTPIESYELEIAFVSLAKNDPSYGTFAIRNTGSGQAKIDTVRITNAESGEELPSNLLKLTSRSIPPGGWEYGNFQIGKSGLQQLPSVRGEYELNRKRYFTSYPVEAVSVWAKDVYFSEDLASVYMYVALEGKMSQEDAATANVTINGEKATVADLTVLPSDNGHSLVCLKIAPPHKLNGGERLCITATWDDGIIYGGCAKVFYAFVAGGTQYGKVMRPVDLEYTPDSVTLNIYNEADFRKSPAVIERVMLNGKDVTAQTVFPFEPFPPDLHNYDDDVRPVIVKNIRINEGKKHRFDFDFRRLEPFRPSPVPDGYFDVQSFSCDVQYGVPYEIDQEEGLQGGVCTLYAGLRNRPETAEIIRRYNSVVSVDPSIPVYAYPHEGTNPIVAHQLAHCNDFITVGQMIPLIPSTFGKSKKFFEHVQYVRHLPVPWAGSVILDNDHFPSPKDLEWLTWGAIGAGSHGIFLTAHEKGDQETIAKCQQGVEEILGDVRSMRPLLGIGKPVNLAYSCNQEGIHIDFLACGTDHLLVVVLNEWSTRSAFQESEPFMAAVRNGVELKIATGTDWKPCAAIDPLHGQPIPFSDSADEISLNLPCFDNVQVVLLCRKQVEDKFKNEKMNPQTEPPVVFLSNPVVAMGTIRPGSTHTLEIPAHSHADSPITLSGTGVSNPNSKPGEAQVSDIALAPRASGTLPIQYTAPGNRGKSVTHVRYTSPECPDLKLSVYLCAEVEQPVELSPLMIDFGYIPVGTTNASREIKLKSSDATATISKITPDNEAIRDIAIADDKQSFRFAAFSSEVGALSAHLTVEMLIDGGTETFVQTVRCTGQFQAIVFASPPQVSVVMADQPRKYTVGIRHISGKPLKITSLSGGETVQCRALPDQPNREQSVELTILPAILETGVAEVKVTGNVAGGEPFSLTVPVSAFSTLQNRSESSR